MKMVEDEPQAKGRNIGSDTGVPGVLEPRLHSSRRDMTPLGLGAVLRRLLWASMKPISTNTWMTTSLATT